MTAKELVETLLPKKKVVPKKTIPKKTTTTKKATIQLLNNIGSINREA